jgi:hypothetical protein
LSGGIGFQSTKVMARSPGVGADTSTARAFAPGRATPVTSISWTRNAPAVFAASAIFLPLSQASKRKLTPPIRSHSVRPAASSGSVNTVRYHQGTAKGLSAGIGTFEKLVPTLYDVPGNVRRFMP